jgi:CRP/FNR family transcriptional regulator, cyclic AMP receptor protein
MAADKKREMLKAVPLFAAMRSRDLDSVERMADSVDLPAGHVLMRQGQTGNEMFVLATGSAVVERNGKEIGRLGPGDVAGEMSLLSEGPRLATVTMLEPSTAFVLGHREFHSLLDDSAEMRQCILDSLAKRIRILDGDSIH